MIRVLALCLCLTALSACALWPFRDQPIDAQIDDLKVEMFAYLSEERLKLNSAARPLAIDPELTVAAQAHSETMASSGAFNGGDAEENIAIQHLITNTDFQGYVGESSAMQYFTPELGIDVAAYARGFVDQWLMSPQHRQTIAYADFDRTGIGVAVNGNSIYVAQLFATDFGLPPPPPNPVPEDE